MPSEQERGRVSYDGRPDTMDKKRDLSQLLTGRVSGDTLRLECADSTTRTITVERRCAEYDDTPEWTGLCIGENEVGYIGTGHGTEYLITVSTAHEPMLPRVGYPSNPLCNDLVMRAEVVESGEPIQAQRTASDLLWRVERYGGR